MQIELAVTLFAAFAAFAQAQEGSSAPPTVVRSIGVADLLAKQSGGDAARTLDLGTDDLSRLLQALATARVEGGEGVFAFDRVTGGDAPLEWRLLVRAPAEDATPHGELWLPAHDRDRVSGKLARVEFTLPADAHVVSDADFEAATKRHAALLVHLGVAGQPLFAALAEGAPPDAPSLPRTGEEWYFTRPIAAAAPGGDDEFDRSFELFSGGRALQENLQVDRARTMEAGAATIAVSSIEGITIAPIDWKSRLGADAVVIEPLALWVPADQIYAGFGSFAALVGLLDELAARGDSLIHLLEPRSEDARSRARLERQLCLSTDALARLLGPAVVRSVAVTASDPYLREGSDVTLLFDCAATEPLLLRLALGFGAAKTSVAGCSEIASDHAGVAIRGLVAPDRSVSSFLAVCGDVVLLGNSRPAIERLIDAHAGALPVGTLGASDEFRFFRARYPFGASADGADRRALLVLSDPFLRRFCGPAWRIGESRRLRCAAVAARLEGLRAAGATADAATLAAQQGLACPCDADATWQFVAGGARCSVHGGAGFLTPVSELPIALVSATEKSAYVQFRQRYQQYWRQYFDPIALSIDAGDPLRLDLTVMPLIEGTDYDELRDFAVGGGLLGPQDGDAHAGTLLHGISHVNPKSRPIHDLQSFTKSFRGDTADGFSWLGNSLEWFVEDGPFWDGLAQAVAADRTATYDYFFEHLAELPLALSFPVRNPLTFAAFVTSLRAFAESTLPNTMRWETRTHEGMDYVVITPDPRGSLPAGEGEAKLQVCYGSAAGRFFLSPNEELLQRALARAVARVAPTPADQPQPPPQPAWLGEHVAMTLDLARLPLIAQLLGSELSLPELVACYSNLPALETWRQRDGERDPVAAHADAFAVRLVCPAGGDYVYDPELRAMKCTKHGHPLAPHESGDLPATLDGLARIAAGITFEQEGVRVRVEATRKKK
jgi:hypothetical protein